MSKEYIVVGNTYYVHGFPIGSIVYSDGKVQDKGEDDEPDSVYAMDINSMEQFISLTDLREIL